MDWLHEHALWIIAAGAVGCTLICVACCVRSSQISRAEERQARDVNALLRRQAALGGMTEREIGAVLLFRHGHEPNDRRNGDGSRPAPVEKACPKTVHGRHNWTITTPSPVPEGSKFVRVAFSRSPRPGR